MRSAWRWSRLTAGSGRRPLLAIAVAALLIGTSWPGMAPVSGKIAPPARRERLSRARSWAYQIQGLERPGAVEALAASPYELLVVEPTRTVIGSEDFDTAGMVRRLHARGKLALAYVDVGEAERYRTYWRDDWRPPAGGERGKPDFIVAADPDGWAGNFPVAFWDRRWRQLMLYDRAAPLQRALDDGFDGVYLDWIEAFADPAVAKVAREEGVDPAAAMIAFVRELRETAHRRDPVFLVVPQNGAELVAGHPAYLGVIDGLAVEDLSFGGGADTAWDDPASGDQPRPADDQAELASLIGVYRAAGLPVFCVDYALQPAHAARARDEAARVGCVSFVSRTPLDRLPSPAPAARPAGGGRGG